MNDTLHDLATRVLPAGHLGNLGTDIILRRGKAGRVWDTHGREYIDFLLGSGPMFAGHAHPKVNEAAAQQIALGSTFFVNNEPAINLAAAISEAVACGEKIRFVSSGTEADAYAMRLARAHRKRDKILKFEGGYHGMSDAGLMSLWPTSPGNLPQAQPDSAGIPASVGAEILVAPFNDLAAAIQLIHAHHDEIAGVIVEPMQRLVPPLPGFLQGLRDITAEYGIVLIFDEVVTGFRLAYGGAQEYYGVIPDICTLGKIIGGGFPLAAIAGRAEIMAHFDKTLAGDGFLPQIGTLSGNPVAAAAGLATLELLRAPGVYEHVFETGRKLMQGLRCALAGTEALVVGEPVMFDAFFTRQARVQNYRDTLAVDRAAGQRFNQALRAAGIFKSDSKFYVCVAHDSKDVSETIVAFHTAAKELKG